MLDGTFLENGIEADNAIINVAVVFTRASNR